MSRLKSLFAGGPNQWLRLTRVRILSQIVFFALFILAVWATWTTRLGGYPVSALLELDPLVMISTVFATGYVYKALGWGLILIAITFVFGRVFCSWACPYGTLHQFVGWLFDSGQGHHRIERPRGTRAAEGARRPSAPGRLLHAAHDRRRADQRDPTLRPAHPDRPADRVLR